MKKWHLEADDPLSLRIAADARLCRVDYCDDQIWELRLSGGNPSALSLETTYGLRARSMRIFPGFVLGDRYIIDPEEFESPPVLRQFFPNYLQVEFSPFEDLLVVAEYWIPDSHTISGRLKLQNLGPRALRMRLRLHALLDPIEDSQALREVTAEGAAILTGQSGNLAPVIFMAGGAIGDSVTYPGLALEQLLAPGVPSLVRWAQAGHADQDQSFEWARKQASRPWDGEIARLELVNASQIEVETGDEDWDAAFAFSQKVALGSFVGPTEQLPHASIVDVRAPDYGFSPRGDGRDYGAHWDGQSAHQVYVALPHILPLAPDLAKGLIRNFLATQDAEGEVDWRPGLGGQRSKTLSIPLLATMAWRIFEHTDDKEFLREVFPGLLAFHQAWFSERHDRDGDGHPEWDHTLQAGFDDWPSFVRWRSWGGALHIGWAETPDLAAYLFREARALEEMALALGRDELLPEISAHRPQLSASMQASWNEEEGRYRHVDRDLHVSPKGRLLGRGKGEFELQIGELLDAPVRVLIRVFGPEGEAKGGTVYVHGRGRRGRHRVEPMVDEDFHWFWDQGSVTSEKIYAEIKRVEVQGFGNQFETEVWIGDYSRWDLTSLMPLWAGIPNEKEAGKLIRLALTSPDHFWREYGLPRCSAIDPAYQEALKDECCGVSVFWNTLIGEALVEYGYLEQAAELMSRLMRSVVGSLREAKGFRQMYSPDQVLGFGERDHLAGIAPLHLLLQIIGLRLFTPHRLEVRGRNPFPWPVTVRWKGLEVRREGIQVQVQFPNGHVEVIDVDGTMLIEQEKR
jgi:hypothetical protein